MLWLPRKLISIALFVVTLRYGFSRPTQDLDVLAITPDNERLSLTKLGRKGGPLHEQYKIYLDFVSMVDPPEDYAERLTEMFPGSLQRIRLFALDPYDLALSKIQRNIQRDRDDVKHLARSVPLDLDILQDRYNRELRPYLGNPDRADATLRLWIEAIEEEGAEGTTAKVTH